MNALMGFVADALTATVFGLGLDRDTEQRLVRAFQKLLWIQNDLIQRHYTGDGAVEAEAAGTTAASSSGSGVEVSTSHT